MSSNYATCRWHFNGVRRSFVHLFTLLTIKTYLNYGTNITDNIGPKKSLKMHDTSMALDAPLPFVYYVDDKSIFKLQNKR